MQLKNKSINLSSKAIGKASKTLSGNGNSNVLATIEYDGTTYNLNIKADETDEKSVTNTEELFNNS